MATAGNNRSNASFENGLPLAMAQALVAGASSALALPPRHWWWVLPFTLSWLLLVLAAQLRRVDSRRRASWRAAAVMFAFGLGWEALGLAWITEAFFATSVEYGGVAYLAVGALAVAAALFMAAAGAVYGALSWPHRAEDVCQGARLAVLVTLFEMMRESPLVLGGFPWNPFAHVLSFETQLPLAQAVTLVGVWGLSALVFFWATLPAQVWLGWRSGAKRAAVALGLGGVLLLAGLWALGQARLRQPVQFSGIRLVIVQPNVPQDEKWRPENREMVFRDLLALTRRGLRATGAPPAKGRKGALHIVVWPESAVPFLLLDSPAALRMIADVLPENAWLFTGALRRAPRHLRQPDGPRKYNSLVVIDHEGKARLIYDKRRLVPFGEYLPLAGLLRPLGIRQLVPMPRGFLVGESSGPHKVENLPPFEAFVCYEIIFGDIPSRGATTRWLVNVTNDAWFGTSAGPHQHLAAARFRALERGLPLVRAANTGISMVQDAHGRELKRLPLQRRGVMTINLPANYSHGTFARFDKWQIVLAMLLLLVICALPTLRCPSRQRV